MNIPNNVKQAVIALWLSVLISAIIAVINKLMGVIEEDTFLFYLVIYAIFCIIPYKISKGSNPTRYILLVITIFSYLSFFGGISDMPKIDLILSILLIPVYVYIFYKLFSKEANEWFLK
jgi:hypothetical protein